MTQQKIPAALRTFFIQRNIGNLLRLVKPARGLAIGISRASHELPKASPLQHHGTTAALALLFRGLLHSLDVFHMLFGIFEFLSEFLVEVLQRVGPLLLAVFNLV